MIKALQAYNMGSIIIIIIIIIEKGVGYKFSQVAAIDSAATGATRLQVDVDWLEMMQKYQYPGCPVSFF